jgi:hypothetical protein
MKACDQFTDSTTLLIRKHCGTVQKFYKSGVLNNKQLWIHSDGWFLCEEWVEKEYTIKDYPEYFL